MTSRDNFSHSVLAAEKGDRLTKISDLRRAQIFVSDLELVADNLSWESAKLRPVVLDPSGELVGLLDTRVSRGWVVLRYRAEEKGRSILDEFVSLYRGDDSKILEFAKCWGVLDLCWHNIPRQHQSVDECLIKLPAPMTNWPREHAETITLFKCLSVKCEPLSTWRFFSEQAAAILRIAAEIRLGRMGKEEDWKIVLNRNVVVKPTLPAHRATLRKVLDWWLRIGKIGIRIDEKSDSFRWHGADLFGELAVQLAAVSLVKEELVFCTYCGKAFAPKKKVKRGAIHVCPSPLCRKRANADRKHRQRQNSKKSAPSQNPPTPYRGVSGGKTNDPLFS